MNKIATFLSEKLAGKLDDLAHRDMREWPPTSVPIYYQPQRQMCIRDRWNLYADCWRSPAAGTTNGWAANPLCAGRRIRN